MSDTPAWRLALHRLVMATSLTTPQARFLLDTLGAPRPEVLGSLLEALSSPDQDRADGAAFLLGCWLQGSDKEVAHAFIHGPAPLPVRALLRFLFQSAILYNRATEEEANLPPPDGLAVAFHVEDVAREVTEVTSPWQRARIVAESLVSDTPLPDDVGPAAVEALSRRMDVDPARVWAELLVHPLTRPAYREAARQALATPSAAAATQLELAAQGLLPGPLLDTAVAEARRHRDATPTPAWRARVGGLDSHGMFPAVTWTDAPEPRALAGLFSPDGKPPQGTAANGLAAERVLVVASRMAAGRGPLLEVPVPFALGCVGAARMVARAAAPPAPSKGARPKKDDDLSPSADVGLGRWIPTVGLDALLPGEEAAVTPASALDPGVLDHPTLTRLLLGGHELPDATKQRLAKDLRGRTAPREDTVQVLAREVSGKRAINHRLAAGVDHAARLTAAAGDAPAGQGLAAWAQALRADPAGRGMPLLLAITRRSLQVAISPPEPQTTSRDDLRPEVFHGTPTPTAQEVVALDLASAALDAVVEMPRAVDGLSDEDVTSLCAEAGLRAAHALCQPAGPEEAALQDAIRAAIKSYAADLPSRQRRDLAEGFTRAWSTLLSQACRGACPHRCLEAPQAPKPLAAFSLDHPRLGHPWPPT
jgi:hypothetical protein